MRKAKLLLGSSLLLFCAACMNSAVTQSGGSGLDEDTGSWSYSPQSCPAGDTNCFQFYNSPGGG